MIWSMLNKFRERHSKKTLWMLTIVIVVVFGLSGGISLLRNSQKETIGVFHDKRITTADFIHYLTMAKIYLILQAGNLEKITSQDIKNLALDFFVLSEKAEKDKIPASDKETIDYIINRLFPAKEFDNEHYERFLRYFARTYNLNISSRRFEEYIRKFIKIDKLFAKYVIVTVGSNEARKMYALDKQKAKIEYLFIPYTKFRFEGNITAAEIQDFYQNNKGMFKEKPKANIRYAIINTADESVTAKLQEISEIKSLKDLDKNVPIEIKETGLISIDDPIEEIGWQPKINKIAFSLKIGQVSPFIEVTNGLLVMEKIDQKPSFTPALETIYAKVKEELIAKNALDATAKYSRAILENILKADLKNLHTVAKQEKIDLKETGYFKYADYIEGLGLDQTVSNIIFSLKKNDIYPQILLRENGAYIIKLKDITEIDEADFKKNEQTYRQALQQYKETLERAKFLEELKSQGNLQVYTAF